MIKPTLGRIVWLRPKDPSYDVDKRHAAIIALVNDDGTVNLGVFNDYGVQENMQNVTLVQGEDAPECGQCEWMPYQKGQAAKTDDITSLLLARIDRLETLLTSDIVGLELPELIGSAQAEEIPDNVTDITDLDEDKQSGDVNEKKDDSAGSGSDTGGTTAATDDVAEDDAGAGESAETEAEALGEEATESAALSGLKAHAAEVELANIGFLDNEGEPCDEGTQIHEVEYTFIDRVSFVVTYDEYVSLADFQFKVVKVAEAAAES